MSAIWLDLFKLALSAGHAPAHADLVANEAVAIIEKRRRAEGAIEGVIAAAEQLDERFSKLQVVKGDPGCAHYLEALRGAVGKLKWARSVS